MVGGSDFNARPFNLATNGHRQPGSAFKPFILARALDGRNRPQQHVGVAAEDPLLEERPRPEGRFDVSNYEDSYLGVASLWSATATSDNSVFAELGMKVKPRRVARARPEHGHPHQGLHQPGHAARRPEGGRDPARDGVRLLDDRERRQAGLGLARAGRDRAGRDPERRGGRRQGHERTSRTRSACSRPRSRSSSKEMLRLVVTSGTGKAAQVGDEDIWGKTGTTENYGDAWFVGGNEDLTVAIWVGYADKLQPMEYEHAGGPVAGGTFPAEIFHDFMTSWLELREQRRLERAANQDDNDETTTDGVDPGGPGRRRPTSRPPSRRPARRRTTRHRRTRAETAAPARTSPLRTTRRPSRSRRPPRRPSRRPPPSGGGGGGGGAGPGAAALGRARAASPPAMAARRDASPRRRSARAARRPS